MNLELMAKKKGLTAESVAHAFTLAVETVLGDHFDLNNIRVDLEDKTVEIIFRVPIDMDFREAMEFNEAVLHADPLSVLFDMQAFPEKLVNRIRARFKLIVDGLEELRDFNYWRKKTHRLVEGVITEHTDGKNIEVLLSDGKAIGYFHESQWVPREQKFYRPGKSFFFYVHKVDQKPFRIHLSRRSIELPALLLKHQLPWHTFVCKKRWIGNKCFVFTDAVLDKKFADIRDGVRQQLNGEVLEVRSFLHYN